MKKKIVCIILSVIMLISVLPLSSSAKEITPVVIVGGYTSPQLYRFDGNGYERENIVEKLWYLDYKDIMEFVKGRVPELTTASFGSLIENSPEKLKEELSSAVLEYIEYLICNLDGTVHENTGTWPVTPEESNMKYILDHEAEDEYLTESIRERQYAPVICEKIGAENVYSFSVDWRKSNILCAFDLGKYIKSVIEYSGAKQISIICESHGGETTSDYISICSIVSKALEGNKTAGLQAQQISELLGIKYDELIEYFNIKYIKNAVLNSPAIGVRLAYDLISGNSHFDITRIIEFVESVFNPLQDVVGGNDTSWEAELEYLLACVSLDKLNAFFNELIQDTGIIDAVLSFGSMWDFIPYEYYDEIKVQKLDTPEKVKAYEGITRYTDFFHYTIMPNLNQNLTYATNKGMNINIVCGSDLTCCTGSQVSGDSLVAVVDSTGAKVASYGKRFSDGYKTDYEDNYVTCRDSNHNHISPAMNIDGAYAYLPENTWYISGQYHAMYWTDSYALELTNKLLFAEEKCDVYSFSEYPQFFDSHNARLSLIASFNNSPSGTLTASDNQLVLENISAKSDLELVNIIIEGADFKIKNYSGAVIPVGESKAFDIEGEIPDLDMKNVRITVYFLESNSLFTMGTRTFNFTIKGGKELAFDKNNPYTDRIEKPVYISVDNIKDAVEAFGFTATLKGLYMSIMNFVNYALKAFGLISTK